MLEYWNTGTMGSGKMVVCCDVEIYFDIQIENAHNSKLPLKTQHSIIPPFHYSMVEAKI